MFLYITRLKRKLGNYPVEEIKILKQSSQHMNSCLGIPGGGPESTVSSPQLLQPHRKEDRKEPLSHVGDSTCL